MLINAIATGIACVGMTALNCVVDPCFPPEDEKILPTLKREQLDEKVQEVSKRLGLTKKVSIIETSTIAGEARAIGSSLFPLPTSVVIDTSLFSRIPEGEQKATLAHELAHIQKNSIPLRSLVYTSVSMSTTIACSILFPVTSMPTLIGLLAGGIAGIVFTRFDESQADKIGFSVCSPEGKRESIESFRRAQQNNKKYRSSGTSILNSLIRHLIIAPNGDSRVDIIHPSLSSRIQALQNLN